jgi:hypothetical protein
LVFQSIVRPLTVWGLIFEGPCCHASRAGSTELVLHSAGTWAQEEAAQPRRRAAGRIRVLNEAEKMVLGGMALHLLMWLKNRIWLAAK